MAKYIDAEKIRAEIDRRYNEYSAKKKTDDFIYYSGMADALDLFEQFLDTLSDENNPEPYSPVYDEDYLNEKIAKASKTWEGVDVDEYMDEVRGREPDKSLEEEARTYCRSSFKFDYDEPNDSFNSHAFEFYDVVELARHFAEWGAEHLRDSTKMIDKSLEEAAEEYQSDTRRHVLDNTPIGTAKDAFIVGAKWQEKRNEKTIKTAEDHAFLAGADWQKEKIIKLIQSRIAEILGDAQPNPILRAELRELIEKIKEDEE